MLLASGGSLDIESGPDKSGPDIYLVRISYWKYRDLSRFGLAHACLSIPYRIR